MVFLLLLLDVQLSFLRGFVHSPSFWSSRQGTSTSVAVKVDVSSSTLSSPFSRSLLPHQQQRILYIGYRRDSSYFASSNTRLYARGKGYEGTKSRIFQDQFKRLKDPKLEKLYKDIELDEDVLKNQDSETKIITGDDLRSKRERDQFLVKKDLDEERVAYEAEHGPFITRIPPKRKRTEEDKILIVEVLNMVLAGKPPAIEEFEKKDFIDFNEFDSFAANKIPGYESESNFAKNIKAWVSYHIRKRDLKIVETDEGERWLFKKFPTGQQKNTEIKRLHAIRKSKRKAEVAARQEAEKKFKLSQKEMDRLSDLIE